VTAACNSVNNTKCSTCSTCPSTHYLAAACNSTHDTQCAICTGCATCNGPDMCVTCEPGFALLDGVCVTSCPAHTFNDNNVCTPCHASCANCTGALATQCSTCHGTSYELDNNNACVNKCADAGKWFDGVQPACQPCAGPCATCYGALATECLSCANATHHVEKGSCVPSCSAGHFYDAAVAECSPCAAGCTTCSSALVCTACDGALFLESNTCHAACPSGFFVTT
jgi:proprotein convertase subtilisin/kexin type 5